MAGESKLGMPYFLSGPTSAMDLTEPELRVLLSLAMCELKTRQTRSGLSATEISVRQRIEQFRGVHKDRVI